jgi:enoyl-CoA hydratase/carnithine racemase
MDLDEITYEKDAGVAEITLDRPQQRNPISAREGGTRDQIAWAVGDAEDDPAIGCVLLKGAGPAFSAGGDLTGNAPRVTVAEHQAFLERAEAFHHRLRTARVPVVAAVHGYCLGAALQLVASCDLVIAADSARFGVPEGRIGLVGATGLVPIVGRQWAKLLVMTGELVDAPTARSIGLVLTVEPDDELIDRSRELCRRIARLPREAVVLNKLAIDAAAEAGGEAAGRAAGLAGDVATLSSSARATAPDGRTFREILDGEGLAGMQRARAAQFDGPWLRSDTTDTTDQ